jgi:hypothetical protein
MVEKYESRALVKDGRPFSFGEIWKVRDELISLLPSDRIENGRNVHFSRTVVIVQNCQENNDEESYIIRVAPLAHRIEFQEKFDIILYPDLPDIPRDGVTCECMVQLQLTQPMLKIDLYEKVGEISDTKKEEIAAIILSMIGLDANDL